MSNEEVLVEIKKINDYLIKCLWMDFEFCQMNGFQIVMAGSIDQSYSKNAINIEFEHPNYVSSLFSWQTDTSKPFIELANNEEALDINEKFNIEHGNYIFKIYTESFKPVPMFIAAKKITCKILDEKPFAQN